MKVFPNVLPPLQVDHRGFWQHLKGTFSICGKYAAAIGKSAYTMMYTMAVEPFVKFYSAMTGPADERDKELVDSSLKIVIDAIMLVGIPATGGADLLPMLIADAATTIATNAVLSKTGSGIRAEGALADIFNFGFMFFSPEGGEKALEHVATETTENAAERAGETAADKALEAASEKSAASAALAAEKEAVAEAKAGERTEKEAVERAEANLQKKASPKKSGKK